MSRNASSFKYLWTTVFNNNGDFSKVPDKVRKTPIKCYVKESSPYFLVTDDFFYVPCYFTKKAVDSFKSAGSTSIADLRSRVIVINDWSLELAKVKSEDVFTSYGGVELKLVVNGFSVAKGNDSISLNRHPANIYRDAEVKTCINQFIWAAQKKAISSGVKGDSLPDVSKLTGKGNVSQGIVKFGAGENFTAFGFKEAKTATVDVSSLGRGGKASAKAVKPTVKGGLSAKKKVISKAGKVGAVAKALSKWTPGGKGTVGKKSTARGGKTPAADESGAGTTDVRTMAKFKKMMEWHKKQKGSK